MNKPNELTALEQAAAQPVPPADSLAGRFALSAHPHPSTDEGVAEQMQGLGFGSVFSEYMAHAHWTSQGGWGQREVVPYGPLTLSPAALVLHYGQEIFEGIKAYRHADGSIWTFRPGFNAARLAASARRMCMPELSSEDFVASLVDLVRADPRWVPTGKDEVLYLRPFMIGTEAQLGVHPAGEVDYYVIASPCGPYFANGFKPVDIALCTDYHRAGPGGTGAAKTGGNYASSLLPQGLAAQDGFAQVCFLDVTGRYLEELGGMNLFVVYADGSVATPRVDTGTVLEGGTRSAIITMLSERGIKVTQTDIAVEELAAGVRSGEVTEMFACGTAAVVTPIGRLAGGGIDLHLPSGPLTRSVYEQLTGVQNGLREDTHGWMYRIC